jgi:hypothetical protein
VNYGAGGAPTSVAVGDFNGDGKLDLAVAKPSSTVSVLLGNGDGTFQAALNYNAGTNPTSVAVGDFNGSPDLVVTNDNDAAGTVSVLIAIGDGGFHPPVTYAVAPDPPR